MPIGFRVWYYPTNDRAVRFAGVYFGVSHRGTHRLALEGTFAAWAKAQTMRITKPVCTPRKETLPIDCDWPELIPVGMSWQRNGKMVPELRLLDGTFEEER